MLTLKLNDTPAIRDVLNYLADLAGEEADDSEDNGRTHMADAWQEVADEIRNVAEGAFDND